MLSQLEVLKPYHLMWLSQVVSLNQGALTTRAGSSQPGSTLRTGEDFQNNWHARQTARDAHARSSEPPACPQLPSCNTQGHTRANTEPGTLPFSGPSAPIPPLYHLPSPTSRAHTGRTPGIVRGWAGMGMSKAGES